VSGGEAHELTAGLGQLESAGFLHRQGDESAASYTFKHALIQQAAYQSLLKATRRTRHAHIARVLEGQFPARVISEPEVVAWHCEQGTLHEEAIGYYERAGEEAGLRSANSEAIGHLRRGVELTTQLTSGADRDELELRLQVALGALLVASRGWGSPEAEAAYARASELCDASGDSPQLFHVLRGLVTFHASRSELATAHEFCSRLLRLAENQEDTSQALLAHQQTAIVLYFEGRSEEALPHFERAIELHDPEVHSALTHVYGEDLGVFTRIWMAWALWILGYPDRAVEMGRQAVALGRAANHPFSLAYALLWTGVVHVMRREYGRARELAEDALEIAQEQDFAFVLGGSRLVVAFALLQPEEGSPRIEEAVEEFQKSVGQLSASGTVITRPGSLSYLVDGYRAAGMLEQASTTLDAATAIAEATSQPYWNAELRRLRGELLLEQPGSPWDEAEQMFLDALALAREQKARAFELRAAMSLCRLFRRTGRGSEVAALLTPIYDWFSEGFDTPDLRDARALLAGDDC
jgi:predicted ATPase